MGKQWEFSREMFHFQIRLVGGGSENKSLQTLIANIIDFKDYITESKTYGRSFEWKVTGNPFEGSCPSAQRIMMHLLIKILRLKNVSGWKLVASADVSAKYRGNTSSQSPRPIDNHSWFFLKDPSMILPPGAMGMQIKDVDNKEEVPEIMDEDETIVPLPLQFIGMLIFFGILGVCIYLYIEYMS